MRCGLAAVVVGIGVMALGTAAYATSPTIAYTYDTLGRLTSATYTGGPNDGLVITYSYDAAGNRTAYQSNGSGNSNHSKFVVIPLMGFTSVTASP